MDSLLLALFAFQLAVIIFTYAMLGFMVREATRLIRDLKCRNTEKTNAPLQRKEIVPEPELQSEAEEPPAASVEAGTTRRRRNRERTGAYRVWY